MAISQRAAPKRAALTGGNTAEHVRAMLEEGNSRWRSFSSRHPHQGSERRRAMWAAENEQPDATVLGCADSRVPPEILFDRGLGDLYTVRAGGQVPDSSVVGSLLYGANQLATPLLVVLGHSHCSVVAEAVAARRARRAPEGPTGFLVEGVLDAIEDVHDDGSDGFLEACTRANTVYVAARLRHEPGLRELVHSGELHVEPAHYDLKRSRVEWLGDKPEHRPGPHADVPSQTPQDGL